MKVPENFGDFDTSVLDLVIIPGENTNLTNLKYKWKVTDFTESEMKIQMYFDNPQYISTFSVNHNVKIYRTKNI